MLTLTIHTTTLDGNVRARLADVLRGVAILLEKSPCAEGNVTDQAGHEIGAWMYVADRP